MWLTFIAKNYVAEVCKQEHFLCFHTIERCEFYNVHLTCKMAKFVVQLDFNFVPYVLKQKFYKL